MGIYVCAALGQGAMMSNDFDECVCAGSGVLAFEVRVRCSMYI